MKFSATIAICGLLASVLAAPAPKGLVSKAKRGEELAVYTDYGGGEYKKRGVEAALDGPYTVEAEKRGVEAALDGPYTVEADKRGVEAALDGPYTVEAKD